MNKRERFSRYWLLFIVYMIFIFLGSSVPGENLPSMKWDLADAVLHFFEYLIFGFLCLRTIKLSYPNFNPKKLFILAVLFSFAFAFSDEVHQYFVPGRLAETRDLISDNLGSLSGILIYAKAKDIRWRG